VTVVGELIFQRLANYNQFRDRRKIDQWHFVALSRLSTFLVVTLKLYQNGEIRDIFGDYGGVY
jgi:hypothetical protein